MSEGNIGPITVDAWQGDPQGLQVVVSDVSPKTLIGSVYEWSQYRAPVSEITTWTNCDNSNALDQYNVIFTLVGTVQNFNLIGSAGTYTGHAKIIKAKPSYPQMVGASSEGGVTQLIKCVWEVELT